MSLFKKKPSAALPEVEPVQTATGDVVVESADSPGFSLFTEEKRKPLALESAGPAVIDATTGEVLQSSADSISSVKLEKPVGEQKLSPLAFLSNFLTKKPMKDPREAAEGPATVLKRLSALIRGLFEKKPKAPKPAKPKKESSPKKESNLKKETPHKKFFGFGKSASPSEVSAAPVTAASPAAVDDNSIDYYPEEAPAVATPSPSFSEGKRAPEPPPMPGTSSPGKKPQEPARPAWFQAKKTSDSSAPSSADRPAKAASAAPQAEDSDDSAREPASKSSRWSFLKSQPKEKAADSPPKSSSKTTTDKKSWFSFGSKKPDETAASEGDERAPRADKKAKPAKPGRSVGVGKKETCLLVELNNGKSVLWAISKNGLVQLDESASPTQAISFSKEDIRFQTEKVLSFTKAEELAVSDIGEEVGLVNLSKELSAIYATRKERLDDLKYAIAPGQQVLDKVLKERKLKGKKLICGFYFKDETSRTSLVVLYALSEDGETSRPQITLNPDNMDFVLSQFATTNKLNRKETEVLLFDNAEFLSKVGGAKFFPTEPVWQGIPVRVVLWRAAVVSAVVAGGAAFWGMTQYTQLEMAQNRVKSLKADQQRFAKKDAEQIRVSVMSFAKAQSLDIAQAFDFAQKAWLPGTRISMRATPTEVKLGLTLVLNNQKTFNNKPSSEATAPADQVSNFVGLKVPEGCQREGMGVTGNMNEIQLHLRCETGNPLLARYRND